MVSDAMAFMKRHCHVSISENKTIYIRRETKLDAYIKIYMVN